MKMVEYAAVIKESKNKYHVYFPDFPAAEIIGETLVNAKEEAVKYLKKIHLDMSELPLTRSIDELEKLYPNDVVSLIQVKI